MPRIVDGDNLLGSWPGRSRSEAEKRALSQELARFALREGRKMVVVFDGAQPEGLAFGPETRFAGRGVRADDVILEHLRKQSDRQGWVVVTGDRSLGDQARWLGARVERCEALRARMASAGAEKPDAGDDLAYWKEVFGGDPGEG